MRRRLVLISWFLSLFLIFPTAFARNDVPANEDCERLLRLQIANDGFETERKWRDYLIHFPGLEGDLRFLRENGHWLEAGGGRGFSFTGYEGVSQVQPKKTLISYVLDRSPLAFDEKTRLITGRFFEDIPPGEIEPANVITDLYGFFSYSGRKDEILRREIELLAPGGHLYLATAPDAMKIRRKGFMRTSMSTLGWLKKIRGIRLDILPVDNLTVSVRITRIPGEELHIPELRFVKTVSKDPPPPRQIYELVEPE